MGCVESARLEHEYLKAQAAFEEAQRNLHAKMGILPVMNIKRSATLWIRRGSLCREPARPLTGTSANTRAGRPWLKAKARPLFCRPCKEGPRRPRLDFALTSGLSDVTDRSHHWSGVFKGQNHSWPEMFRQDSAQNAVSWGGNGSSLRWWASGRPPLAPAAKTGGGFPGGRDSGRPLGGGFTGLRRPAR
jgi:hypothetical protein